MSLVFNMVGGGGGGVETCTVTFSSNISDISGSYAYDKILLTVFENNETTTKTVSMVNNTTVSNVVLNSVGFVLYTSVPSSTSTNNATKLYNSSFYYVFTFTGNASIYSIMQSGGGGGA